MKNFQRTLLVSCLLACLFSSCGVNSVVKTNFSGLMPPTNNNLLYYYLPETQLTIAVKLSVETYYENDTVLVGKNVVERTYTITPSTIADTKDLLMLEYNKKNMYSDELTFVVNDKGLLTSSDISADDKTASIINDISSALSKIKPTSNENKPATKNADKKIETVLKEYTRIYNFKASDIAKTALPVALKIMIINQKKPMSEPKILDDSFEISAIDEKAVSFDLANIKTSKVNNKVIEGILTRPIKNMGLVIKPNTDANAAFYSIVQVTDASKLIVLPVNRTAFTKTTNALKLSNGIVIENKITRPSPVKGFFEIPINIAKAVVSIPAQIVQIRIDKATIDKSLLAVEKERLNAELGYKLDLIKINRRLDSLSRIK